MVSEDPRSKDLSCHPRRPRTSRRQGRLENGGGLVPRWTCLSDSRGASGPLTWGMFPWVGTKGICFEWSSLIILCPCLPFPSSLPSFIFPLRPAVVFIWHFSSKHDIFIYLWKSFFWFYFPNYPIAPPLSLFSFLGPTVVWLMLVLKPAKCPYKILRVTMMCHCALTLILVSCLSIMTTFYFILFLRIIFIFIFFIYVHSIFIFLI